MADHDDYSEVEQELALQPDTRAAADLRGLFVRQPRPDTTARHLAAMVSAISAPVVPIAARRMRAALAGTAVAAGLLATGGFAAAGVLPGPVQVGVAKAAHTIGIDLPDSSENDDGPGSDQAPEKEGTDPGKADEAPGQQDQTGAPGNSENAPGQGATNPGKADEAPGQQDQPGNSENAPGLGGENPGRSDIAPGQTESGGNNKPAEPPGQVANSGQGNGQDRKPDKATG